MRFPPADVVEQDRACVGAADHELGRPDPQVQRAAKRCPAQHGDAAAGLEAQRGHPLEAIPDALTDTMDAEWLVKSRSSERFIQGPFVLIILIISVRNCGGHGELASD